MPERTNESKGLPSLATELKDLVVAYAKQETVEPLKNLGRFVAFGIMGSVLLAAGLVLLVLAVLRALQTEASDTFDGDWTFAPYLLTLIICVVVAALAGRAIGAAKRRTRRT